MSESEELDESDVKEYLGPSLVQLDIIDLRRAIRNDCVTFFAFYLEEELTLAVPDIHLEIWEELLKRIDEINQRQTARLIRKLFAIPRGFAKTTVAKLAAILLLKYSYMSFLIYVSKTNGHAKNAIRDIIMWLCSEQERKTFAKAVVEKSSETDSLWILLIASIDPLTGAMRMKRIILRALGADQHVRGLNILNRRPQIALVDDIEDDDNTTVELQPKLDVWFLGAFRKALAGDAFILMIGNMLKETSLLARLSQNPIWNPTVYGAIVMRNGELESLWEEKFPLDSLLEEYSEYQMLGKGHVWESEMMNLTNEKILAADFDGLIRIPRPNPEDLTDGALVLDPARGLTGLHDPSAITVHCHIKGLQIPAIIDHWTGRVAENLLFDEMMRLSIYWGITTWFIESDGAQALYIPLFTMLLAERRIPKELIQLIPIDSGKKKKASRIFAFRNVVSAGSYAMADSEDEIVVRLSQYNAMVEHEDLEDSAAYGVKIWESHGDSIRVRGVITQLHQVMGGWSGDSGTFGSDYAPF